jgi:hypothetical protein
MIKLDAGAYFPRLILKFKAVLADSDERGGRGYRRSAHPEGVIDGIDWEPL